MSVFIPTLKKGNAKECSNYNTIALISHASKVMLKILQARLQQHVNHELLSPFPSQQHNGTPTLPVLVDAHDQGCEVKDQNRR